MPLCKIKIECKNARLCFFSVNKSIKCSVVSSNKVYFTFITRLLMLILECDCTVGLRENLQKCGILYRGLSRKVANVCG